MRKTNSSISKIALSYFVAILLLSCSGKPVINSFTVTPMTATADDTMRVNWDVKGKPTLLVHQKETADSTVKLMEMTLVVTNGDKEARRPIQVSIIPKNSTTKIIIRTDLRGDTLIAEDVKNPDRWGDRFEIATVSSGSNRQLIVTHANKTATLDKSGTTSSDFAGTPVEGKWVLKSLMTAAEKANHTLAPETLQVNAVIKYKRR